MSEENYNNSVEQKDVEDNKIMGVLAYIIFIVPLLVAKESPFARFHTNQGFLVFLLYFACGVIAIIPFIGWVIALVGWFFGLACIIMGIINALGGQKKPLPIIGKYEIIK
jgi:Predicted membrane protein